MPLAVPQAAVPDSSNTASEAASTPARSASTAIRNSGRASKGKVKAVAGAVQGEKVSSPQASTRPSKAMLRRPRRPAKLVRMLARDMATSGIPPSRAPTASPVHQVSQAGAHWPAVRKPAKRSQTQPLLAVTSMPSATASR